MEAIERMRLYLREEFGIETDEQLEFALRGTKSINISPFVAKPRKAVQK